LPCRNCAPFAGVIQLSASSAKIIGAREAASNGAQMMVWKRMLGRNELTAVEARQGYLDRPVLIVLIASLRPFRRRSRFITAR